VKDSLTLTLNPVPVVNAGGDQTVCADINGIVLDGKIANASGGIWSTGSGSGTFLPSPTDLNATFIPSASQIANGRANLTLTSTGNGTCGEVKDVMTIFITPAPTISAGPDISACIGIDTVTLSSTVTVATGVSWSTIGGSGTFSPGPNTLNPKYSPSPADSAAGSVTFVVSTTGNGTCQVKSDTMVMTFTPAPPIYAGPDQTVCATNVPVVSLSGSGSSGYWTNGGGTFYPDNSSLTASYTPSASEVAAGFVELILVTSADGSCAPGKDTIMIDILPGPVLNAGSDTAICANGGPLQLNGIFSVATGVTWETSGSGTFSDINSATATYTPSASDIIDGNVILKMTSTGNGICNAVSDYMEITITPAPTVSAGSDKNVCAGTDSIRVNGAVTIASGVVWSTLGSGSFAPNTTSLVTDYLPSPADSTAGFVKLVITTTGHGNCTAVSDTMLITFSTGPTAYAGSDTSICKDAVALPLHGVVTSAMGGEWSSSGTGNFTPNNNSLSTSYYFTDADKTSGSIKIYLTTTGNGTCSAVQDSLTITFTETPTITTSGNQIVCEDTSAISLSAVTTIATGVTWSASGSGTFSAPNSNNTSYTLSANDIAAGSVNIFVTSTGNGTCNAVTENLTITITPKPTVNAGLDQIVCADAGTVQLKGSVTIATGGEWSILTGNGSIAAINSLNTTYSLTNADTTSKSVTLVLTSTGNGSCKPVSDTLNIGIISAPTVDAGSDQPVCADTSFISLSGKYTVAGGVEWATSGSGTFTPSANLANTAYIPSAADTAAGTVKLYLTTVANGTCLAVTDSLTINISPAPVVNAGSDDIICTNENSVTLSGNIYHATGGTWTSSGTGTFTPDANTLNAQYIPSASDHANGGVILTLTSTGNGMCKQVEDVMNITIYPAPLADVNAGFDQTLCADVATIQLNGSVKNAGGGIWTSNGSGTFSDPTDLKGLYTLTGNDKNSGKVVFVLTTIANGFCNAVSDTMEATITPAPTVMVSNDTTVCADIVSIPVSANITVATGGEWTSSGTGLFAPTHTALTTNYIPSTTERLLGTTYLTLTTTGNGTCNPVSNSMKITYTKAPTADAGSDIIECADAASVNLNGKVTIATGGEWTTTGKGTFSPDQFALNAVYIPAPEDSITKVINFTLTTTGNGNCNEAKDQVKLTLTPAPTVNAGPDRVICADASSVPLTGKIANATGALWTTLGSGTFTPSATALNANYIPSAGDKATGLVTLVLTTTGNGLCDAVSDTMLLTIKPQPIVTAVSSSPCVYTNGVALTGTVTHASGIKWTTSGTGTFAPNNSVLNPVYYPSAADIAASVVTITATSTGNGTCNPVSTSITLHVTPMPEANAGKDQFVCIGGNTNLVAKIIPNTTYQWSTGNGIVISNLANTNVQANSDTSFILKVTDHRGCFSYDTVNIYSLTPPVFNMIEEFCFADTLIINSMASNLPPYPGEYLWYHNNRVLAGENKPVIGVANPGSFVVVYAVGGCANSDTSEVHALPVIDVGADKIACIGNNVSLNANVSGTPTFNYIWKANSTTVGTSNPSNIVALADTNVYMVTVTDGNGCQEKDSLIVYGIPVPDISLSDTSVCEGNEIVLNARPSNYTNYDNLQLSFIWEKEGQTLTSTHDTLRVNSAGKYTSIVSIGECVNSNDVIITYNALPRSDMPDLVKFCPDDKNGITLEATSGDGYKYYWHETGDSSQTTFATSSGMHYVTIINKNNCYVIDSTEVFDVCPPKVFVPNIFTPGKSGPDEYLTIFGKYFTNFKITVFNRWGEIIFHSEDRYDAWDGKYLGEIVPVGEYTWIVTYEGITEEYKGPHRQEGSVTVVK
ncbi:MAG TPA: gliding motility-associated C-terminal domain-containing protein, partial [Cytophagaceae bacterium]